MGVCPAHAARMPFWTATSVRATPILTSPLSPCSPPPAWATTQRSAPSRGWRASCTTSSSTRTSEASAQTFEVLRRRRAAQERRGFRGVRPRQAGRQAGRQQRRQAVYIERGAQRPHILYCQDSSSALGAHTRWAIAQHLQHLWPVRPTLEAGKQHRLAPQEALSIAAAAPPPLITRSGPRAAPHPRQQWQIHPPTFVSLRNLAAPRHSPGPLLAIAHTSF